MYLYGFLIEWPEYYGIRDAVFIWGTYGAAAIAIIKIVK